MRIGVVGSRDYADLAAVDAFVDSLPAGVVVVSGGARGVDSRAERRARARGLAVESKYPDWSRGPGAGFLRNAQIVARAELVVAFIAPCGKCQDRRTCPQGGWSHGTSNTVELAREAGKLAWVAYEYSPSSHVVVRR